MAIKASKPSGMQAVRSSRLGVSATRGVRAVAARAAPNGESARPTSQGMLAGIGGVALALAMMTGTPQPALADDSNLSPFERRQVEKERRVEMLRAMREEAEAKAAGSKDAATLKAEADKAEALLRDEAANSKRGSMLSDLRSKAAAYEKEASKAFKVQGFKDEPPEEVREPGAPLFTMPESLSKFTMPSFGDGGGDAPKAPEAPKAAVSAPAAPAFSMPAFKAPDLSGFKAPDMSGFKMPEMPEMPKAPEPAAPAPKAIVAVPKAAEAKAPKLPAFSMPAFKAPDMSGFKMPEMPKIPEMAAPDMSGFKMPEMPEMPKAPVEAPKPIMAAPAPIVAAPAPKQVEAPKPVVRAEVKKVEVKQAEVKKAAPSGKRTGPLPAWLSEFAAVGFTVGILYASMRFNKEMTDAAAAGEKALASLVNKL
ncbi:hypothetical protein FOA52_007402 [Chlamydomonas sp. UWO 241]|nr:hypothetical protein FOA52_007402 [Chlamydomonas sp. UWO 241]